MKSLKILISLVLGAVFVPTANSQYGHISNRAMNYLNANQVRTVFYNTGLMGNLGEISFEWPQGTGNEAILDFVPLLGVRFLHPSGDTLISVCTSDGPSANPDGTPGGGTFWGFEPLPGFHRVTPGETPHVAMSDQPETWPENWEGRWLGTSEPSGQWADQEAYYQMDDNADMEWRTRTDSLGNQHVLYAIPEDTTRGGLGLRVEARYLEFDEPVLEDMIILMYILHNDGAIEFLSSRFGFVVGNMAGGRNDSEDDLVYFDSDSNVVYFTDGDDHASPGWDPVNDSINVGAVGTFFLKSPDDLGVASFDFFSPPGVVRMGDDNALWTRLTPGRLDSTTLIPQDCDYTFGTGEFQLMPGASDTIIAAVAYGIDPNDVISKAGYVRTLYNSGRLMDVPQASPISIPSELSLFAFPNPFNNTLSVSLEIPMHQEVSIILYDLLGREVDVIHRGRLNSTTLSYTAPATLASGIYFLRAATARHSAMQKVVLLK